MSTNCAFPPELDDKQLLAYLDDPDANQETAHHLRMCPYCRDRAESLDRFQKHLTARLYRTTCPSPMELGEYHMHILPAPQQLVIAQHLRECPHCALEVSQLEEFLSGDLEPMEDGLLVQAQVLIARLVNGSNGESVPAFGALRGEAKGPITLEADGIVIVLDIQPSNERKVNILGQMAADDQDQWTEARVELHQGGELEFSTTLDDLGAFHAEDIMPGSKVLRIISKDSSRIVVSNFEVST